jgi:hypothetical protein
MQNKRRILIISMLILLVGVSAFIGGQWWNRRNNPVPLGAPFEGDFRSMIVPASELPAALPAVTGQFIGRQDNTIIVEVKSLETGGMISSSPSNTRNQRGPQVEVVITSTTMIYRETTNPSEPLSAENQTIRQTVEPATLDDLDPRSMVMVWGRKSGDRVIADVLMFADLVAVKSAIFEDCEICP